MKPAEDAVGNKLRQRLTEFRDVHQLMHEFKRYNELMKRPNIAEALRSEREQFLGQLANYVKVIIVSSKIGNFKVFASDRIYVTSIDRYPSSQF